MKNGRQHYHDSPLLTVKECASFIKCHPSTIYRLLKRGTIPSFRIGTDWRFNRDDIVRWVQELTDQERKRH